MRAVAFSPYGQRLATGGEDCAVILWDEALEAFEALEALEVLEALEALEEKCSPTVTCAQPLHVHILILNSDSYKKKM
jgi:WD40 repeat protein